MSSSVLCTIMALSFWIGLISTYVQGALYTKYRRWLFHVKILLDFLSYPASFLAIALVNYASITDPFAARLTVIYCIAYSVFSLCIFTCQFAFWGRTYFTFKLSSRIFPIILSDFLFGLFMNLSTINYAIYYACPAFYKIPADLSSGEMAFEFVYYTFTLAVTYSSNSISAAHIVTKIIQIIEICYCYIIVGNVVVKIINEQKPKSPSK